MRFKFLFDVARKEAFLSKHDGKLLFFCHFGNVSVTTGSWPDVRTAERLRYFGTRDRETDALWQCWHSNCSRNNLSTASRLKGTGSGAVIGRLLSHDLDCFRDTDSWGYVWLCFPWALRTFKAEDDSRHTCMKTGTIRVLI